MTRCNGRDDHDADDRDNITDLILPYSVQNGGSLTETRCLYGPTNVCFYDTSGNSIGGTEPGRPSSIPATSRPAHDNRATTAARTMRWR